jgi:hypothetical protein
MSTNIQDFKRKISDDYDDSCYEGAADLVSLLRSPSFVDDEKLVHSQKLKNNAEDRKMKITSPKETSKDANFINALLAKQLSIIFFVQDHRESLFEAVSYAIPTCNSLSL